MTEGLHLAHLTCDTGQEDWLIPMTISPSAWNGDVTGVLGTTKSGARTRKCSRVEAAALRGFAAQITHGRRGYCRSRSNPAL